MLNLSGAETAFTCCCTGSAGDNDDSHYATRHRGVIVFQSSTSGDAEDGQFATAKTTRRPATQPQRRHRVSDAGAAPAAAEGGGGGRGGGEEDRRQRGLGGSAAGYCAHGAARRPFPRPRPGADSGGRRDSCPRGAAQG